jgi:hypothetical protein
MNTRYRNSLVQRAAVAAWREANPSTQAQLSAAEIWKLITPDEQHAVASAPVVDPLEAQAVVEYTADEYIAALDAESMVARGLDKSDIEALSDASAVIAQWMQPDGTPLPVRYDVRALGDQFSTMVADPIRPEEMQYLVADSLEKLCGNQDRIPYSARGRLFPVVLSLAEPTPGQPGESAPPKVHFIRCRPSSVAGQRGETVWAILHLPVFEAYSDGSGKVGTSRWVSKGSTFPGVARAFRSIALAADARFELQQALSTYRRITAQMNEQGDGRYSDDPVRTQAVQLDVAPRFQAGPKAPSIA